MALGLGLASASALAFAFSDAFVGSCIFSRRGCVVRVARCALPPKPIASGRLDAQIDRLRCGPPRHRPIAHRPPGLPCSSTSLAPLAGLRSEKVGGVTIPVIMPPDPTRFSEAAAIVPRIRIRNMLPFTGTLHCPVLGTCFFLLFCSPFQLRREDPI